MFKNRYKNIIFTLLTLSLVLVLAACGSSSDSSEKVDGDAGDDSGEMDQIEISVTHFPTGAYAVPYNAGMEKGIFEKYNIEITEIYGSGGGGTTVRNVLSGDLPFGDVATSASIQAFMSGAPIKIVGGAVQSLGDLVFVTRDGDDIDDIYDLEGKNWAFTNPGSVTESVSQLIFEVMDIDPNSLDVIAAGGISEGLTMLQAGEVDSAIMLEPTYSVEKDKWKELFRVSEHIEKYQQTTIITSPQLMEENPDLVERFLAAYQESVDWVYENPEEAGKIFAKSAEIDEEASITSVKDLVEARHWSAEIDAEAMNSMLRAMELIGSITDKDEIEWEELFDLSALPEEIQLDLNELE